MNSMLRRNILYCLLILMLTVAGCTEDKESSATGGSALSSTAAKTNMRPAADQAAPVPQPSEALEILRYWPEGDVPYCHQIVLMFNQPMVALGDYGNVPKDFLKIEPPLKGKPRWLNQYTLAFIPDELLLGSYKGKVSVAPGIKALSGAVLAQGLDFQFALPEVAVSSSYEDRYVYTNRDEALKPRYNVFFNQPVEIDSMKAVFSFKRDGMQKSVAASITPNPHPYYDKGTGFIFLAKEALPPDTEYKIILEPGVKAVGGHLPGEEISVDAGRTFSPLKVSFGHEDYSYPKEHEKVPPEYGLNVTFSNPVILKDALSYIKLNNGYDLAAIMEREASKQELAEEIVLESDETVPQSSSSLYIPGGFLPDTEYVISIEPGLKDIYGQEIKEKAELRFRTRHYSSFVNLDRKYGLMERATTPKVEMAVSNMEQVEVQGYALPVETAVKFLKSIRASSKYYYIDEEKSFSLIRHIRPHKLVIPVPGGAKNGAVVIPLDLRELFGDEMEGHLLLVRSVWTETDSQGQSFKRSRHMLIQFSDLGLGLKIGKSSSLAWVTDMVKGEGFKGASVELWNSKGEMLWHGLSDDQGLSRMPGSSEFAKNDDRKTDYYVVARADGNMSLWGAAWDSGLERWRFNMPFEYSYSFNEKKSIDKAWLLSALPIYKPGETAKFKIIARQSVGDDLKNIENRNLNLRVHDARGKVVLEAGARTNEFGSLSYELPIAEDAALGMWSVSLGVPGQTEDFQYAGSFNVYAYRAPAFAIKFLDMPKNIISGDKVSINAQADYHFGSPVMSQPVNYSVTAYENRYFSLPGLSDFNVVNVFSDNNDYEDSLNGYKEPATTVLSDNGELTADGRFQLAIDLSAPKDAKPIPRDYAVNMSVMDVDMRTVSSSSRFTAHPAAIYAGLMTPSYIGKAGEPKTIKAISADLEGKILPGVEMEIKLFRRDWKTVRRKSVGEVYEYVSKILDTEISSQKAVSADMPLDISVTPDKPGYYFVVAKIKDKKGRVNEASTSFYATGEGAAGWRRSNDDILTLVADKKEYKPGDVAKIMVQSPFSQGHGLLTVERSGVKESRVFRIESQTPVLELPISEADSPNTFVSVMLVQGRIADKPVKGKLDLGKPSVRLGYLELSVPSEKDLLGVDVKVDRQEAGPGDEVNVKLAVRDPKGQPLSKAEVALVVADAAVLQLGGENAYFPATLFHEKNMLGVQSANNLVNLIGRRNWGLKGANPGGGGGEMLGQTSIDIRRNFAALVHFEPSISLDEKGEASVKIKMPENLSTFKIFAVATGDGRLTGTGESSVLVTRQLLVRLALPGYAGVGDEFKASVIVTNRGKKDGEANVSLDGEGFSMLEEKNNKSVKVKAGASEQVGFKVKAGGTDKAKFIFAVKMADESDAAEFVIPVSYANRLETQASYERIIPGEYKTDLKIQPGADPGRGGIELELAPSLVGVLDEPFKWMTSYPHGCVEQSTSQAYANLVWLGLKNRLTVNPGQEEKARKHVAKQIAKLQAWNLDGGYNYWPENRDWSSRSIYLSAYVLDFLISAREAGFKVSDDELLKPIKVYLKNSINGEIKWPKWYSETAKREAKSYIIAMLSRADENVAAHVELLYSQRGSASIYELINLLRSIHYQPKGASGRTGQIMEVLKLLMRNVQVSAGKISVDEKWSGSPEIWSSVGRSTSMALLALCEVAPSNELVPGLVRWIMDNTQEGHFGSTQNNVYALQALALYVKLQEPVDPAISIEALVGGSKLAAAKFNSFKDNPVNGSLPISAISSESPAVIYHSQGEGQGWASLKLKTAPKEPDLSAGGSGGFILSRSFEVVAPEKKGEGIDSFKPGEVVKVTVTMMVPATRHNMLMVDRVPAGFEPVNFSLADADMSLMQYTINNNQNNGYSSGYFYWYDHQEIWPDKVAVYSTYLEPGVYTFSYLARAITPGSYLTPGPQAEEMYAPETFGRGPGHRLTISEQ